MSPLRIVVAGIGAFLLLSGLFTICVARVFPPAFGAVIFGALILIGTLAEQYRYKRVRRGQPGPGWRLGAERFVDPESGKIVAVWYNDRIGERAYAEVKPGAQ